MNIQQREPERFAGIWNDKGLSLAEMVIALAAFCIIAFLLVPSVSVIKSNRELASNRLQEMEWDVFLNQAKKELRVCGSVDVLSGKLVMKNGKDTIIYEKYGSMLRRRVNLTGHEVLFQNIASVTFIRNGQAITISMKDIKGKEYKGSIHSFVNWEGG
ncbi:competence type IV pilus minor pilin ComGF [Neobacillus piezotolerans]|nr:competence type IV pilus minor pilin ComGF [Neobacillus piezotolerans]